MPPSLGESTPFPTDMHRSKHSNPLLHVLRINIIFIHKHSRKTAVVLVKGHSHTHTHTHRHRLACANNHWVSCGPAQTHVSLSPATHPSCHQGKIDLVQREREKQSDQRGRGSEREHKQEEGKRERERERERALPLWLDGFNSHSKGQTYDTWERDSLFLPFIHGSTTVSLLHAQHTHTGL